MNRSTPDLIVLILTFLIVFTVISGTVILAVELFRDDEADLVGLGKVMAGIVNTLVGAVIGYAAGRSHPTDV